MYKQRLPFALCLICWLPSLISCQAPVGGAVRDGFGDMDAPAEPVLIEKEMDVDEGDKKEENVDDEDDLDFINHEEKRGAEHEDEINMQVRKLKTKYCYTCLRLAKLMLTLPNMISPPSKIIPTPHVFPNSIHAMYMHC